MRSSVSQPHSSGNEVIIRARKEGRGGAGYWAIGLRKHRRSKIAPSQPAPDIKGSGSQRSGAEAGWSVFPAPRHTHTGRMRSAVGALLACAALGECGLGRTVDYCLCVPCKRKAGSPKRLPFASPCHISILR